METFLERLARALFVQVAKKFHLDEKLSSNCLFSLQPGGFLAEGLFFDLAHLNSALRPFECSSASLASLSLEKKDFGVFLCLSGGHFVLRTPQAEAGQREEPPSHVSSGLRVGETPPLAFSSGGDAPGKGGGDFLTEVISVLSTLLSSFSLTLKDFTAEIHHSSYTSPLFLEVETFSFAGGQEIECSLSGLSLSLPSLLRFRQAATWTIFLKLDQKLNLESCKVIIPSFGVSWSGAGTATSSLRPDFALELWDFIQKTFLHGQRDDFCPEIDNLKRNDSSSPDYNDDFDWEFSSDGEYFTAEELEARESIQEPDFSGENIPRKERSSFLISFSFPDFFLEAGGERAVFSPWACWLSGKSGTSVTLSLPPLHTTLFSLPLGAEFSLTEAEGYFLRVTIPSLGLFFTPEDLARASSSQASESEKEPVEKSSGVVDPLAASRSGAPAWWEKFGAEVEIGELVVKGSQSDLLLALGKTSGRWKAGTGGQLFCPRLSCSWREGGKTESVLCLGVGAVASSSPLHPAPPGFPPAWAPFWRQSWEEGAKDPGQCLLFLRSLDAPLKVVIKVEEVETSLREISTGWLDPYLGVLPAGGQPLPLCLSCEIQSLSLPSPLPPLPGVFAAWLLGEGRGGVVFSSGPRGGQGSCAFLLREGQDTFAYTGGGSFSLDFQEVVPGCRPVLRLQDFSLAGAGGGMTFRGEKLEIFLSEEGDCLPRKIVSAEGVSFRLERGAGGFYRASFSEARVKILFYSSLLGQILQRFLPCEKESPPEDRQKDLPEGPICVKGCTNFSPVAVRLYQNPVLIEDYWGETLPEENAKTGEILLASACFSAPSRQAEKHHSVLAEKARGVVFHPLSLIEDYDPREASDPGREESSIRWKNLELEVELLTDNIGVLVPRDKVNLSCTVGGSWSRGDFELGVGQLEIADGITSSSWRRILALEKEGEIFSFRREGGNFFLQVPALRLYFNYHLIDFLDPWLEIIRGCESQSPNLGNQGMSKKQSQSPGKLCISALRLRLDYKGRPVDYQRLAEGRLEELMNFFALDGSQVELPPLSLPLGPGLGERILDSYFGQISAADAARALAGWQPIKPLTGAESIFLPLGTAALELAGRAAGGIYAIFGPAPPAGRSLYSQRGLPRDPIRRGVEEGFEALILEPLASWRKKGSQGFLVSLAKGIPLAFLRPLLGLMGGLGRRAQQKAGRAGHRRKDLEDKYK